MSSLKKIFEKVNSRKVKVFLLFLLCAFLAWAVSTLSEEYESRANFEIAYKNLPDSLLSMQSTERNISAKIEASGFQFLGYAINPKTIQLDVRNVLEQDGDYFLTASTVKSQLENQLPNSISLIELDEPIYWTDLYLVDTKTIPIRPRIELKLTQNHLLEGKLALVPDSVQIKGPKKDIENIESVPTLPLVLDDVSSNFSQQLGLQSLDSLANVVLNVQEVNISGKVVRFSEKEFDVTINTINVPEGYRLRMFPDHVQLICKAGIERLKELKTSDFEVFVDYTSVIGDNYLFVQLLEEPEDVFSVRLLKDRVEFVLEKI
ncbi:MAG: YbbR-like domain-containing protein [Bacteroidota bacterium]